MLHFSTSVKHEPSECYKRVLKELAELNKPQFMPLYTEFQSKYTFNLGSKSTPPDPTLHMSATYREIKERPQLWVLKSPKSA
jgi:hypothetical protein